ncbi:hypothetical protein MBLNU457_7299t1 [Dothideomycetes sp. NU457]
MQDPSQGVPPPLKPHVALISSQRYPFIAQLPLEQAFKFLIEAPKVVQHIAPMSWQYLNAPQDGQIYLTWIGAHMNSGFPTDGFLWVGQEERAVVDCAGYTVEVMTQHSGFKPGAEAVACHARKRYRLVAKHPTTNANPPDTHLWIVHYGPSDQNRLVPANQVPITQQMRDQMQARQWIESQGRLERQDFMLHDRDKWPQVKFGARGMQPGQVYGQNQYGGQNPMASVANPRFSGQFYQQGQQGVAGPSPAKRQRPNPPAQLPPTATVAAAVAAQQQPDSTIEIEEDVTVGDYLDLLTQRDISLTRYMQHHEWMEEVYSSPYATGHIIPTDLGFGLMGELAGLTEGVFETLVMGQEKARADGEEGTALKQVKPEQLSTFEKRVNEYLENGQSEIQRMKDEHAKKMDELKRSKKLLQAEKRLRGGLNDDGKGQVNSQQSDEDAVTKEIGGLLGVSIRTQKEARMVERGGLRERVKPQPQPVAATEQISGDAMDAGAQNGHDAQHQTAANEHSNVPPPQMDGASESVQQPANTDQPMSQQQAQQPQPDQQAQQQETKLDIPDQGLEDMETLNEDNFQLESMDLDMGDSQFDLGDMSTEQDQSYMQQASMNQTASTTAQPPSTNQAMSTQDGPQSASQGQDASEFNNFDDFTAGDGLIDFEGGDGGDLGLDLTMDNSAFGDAFHETEGTGGEDGSGAVQ